jgi:hypothetical protein
MSKVQSTFTYTIPAQSTDKIAPAAPIQCGCSKLILILKDRSVAIEELQGIIEASIISVTVSQTPVTYVEPGGYTVLVWRYDYVLEYETADFVDPTFRIRRCDIESNCCHGCAQVYTDRKIDGTVQKADGYVQMVQGSAVDNDDPVHPIVNDASLERIPGTNSITFTSNSGSEITFAEGIAAVSAAVSCKGIAAGQSLTRLQMVGNQLFIETATMPSVVEGSVVDSLDPPGDGIDITAIGTYALGDMTLEITNPNTCLALKGFFFVDASAIIDPLQDSADLDLEVSFVDDDDADSFGSVDSYQNGGDSDTRRITLRGSSVVNMNEINGVNLAPGDSITVRLGVRVRNTDGGEASTFLKNIFASIRFFGVAG